MEKSIWNIETFFAKSLNHFQIISISTLDVPAPEIQSAFTSVDSQSNEKKQINETLEILKDK